MFVNREKEIDRLSLALKRDEAQVIVVWGRRRCGKTALLREILSDWSIFLTADLRERPLQLISAASEISRIFDGFNRVIYPDWESLLIQLNRLAAEKVVLCLDEFPYLVKNSPELPTVIQKLIDQRRLDNVHLILCGSSQQMMQGIALNSNSPLYGRSTEILRINPMEIEYMAKYLRIHPEEAIREFGVWGGVPRYWEIRKKSSSFKDAVIYNVLDRNGILFEEPERLFADEMRTSVQSWSVLSLIATGSHRLSEIAGRLNKPATHLSRLISVLLDLGYIRREIPYGESPKSSKRSLYKINDSFLNFYFHFVLQNKSMLELGQVDQVWELISTRFEHYTSNIWEESCRKGVTKLFTQTGQKLNPALRWWGTGLNNKPIEIDLVCETLDHKSLLVGEVKWSNRDNIKEIERKLDMIIPQLPFAQGRKVIKAAFVRKKPSGYSGDMLIFGPEDLIL